MDMDIDKTSLKRFVDIILGYSIALSKFRIEFD